MEFSIKAKFSTSAETIYLAWLDSDEHSKMIGGSAEVSDEIGGEFTSWDGYIEGRNIELEPNKRILQTWRTTEFEDDEPYSLIEILLNEVNGQTELTLIHTNLPDHGEQYRKGWNDHYFQPMKEYFSK